MTAARREGPVPGVAGIKGSAFGRIGMAAATGSEAEGVGKGGRRVARPGLDSIESVYSNKGGCVVGSAENQTLLYIWILKAAFSG